MKLIKQKTQTFYEKLWGKDKKYNWNHLLVWSMLPMLRHIVGIPKFVYWHSCIILDPSSIVSVSLLSDSCWLNPGNIHIFKLFYIVQKEYSFFTDYKAGKGEFLISYDHH